MSALKTARQEAKAKMIQESKGVFTEDSKVWNDDVEYRVKDFGTYCQMRELFEKLEETHPAAREALLKGWLLTGQTSEMAYYMCPTCNKLLHQETVSVGEGGEIICYEISCDVCS